MHTRPGLELYAQFSRNVIGMRFEFGMLCALLEGGSEVWLTGADA